MKFTAEDFLKGKFNCEESEMLVTPERLNLKVHEDSEVRGSIDISSEVDFVAYTDNEHMKVTPVFNAVDGKKSRADFIFDANGLEAGEEYEGKIEFVSDIAETAVRFHVTVTQPGIAVKIGDEIIDISDDFQLTNCASIDFKAAAEAFATKEYENVIVKKHDRSLVYKLLLNNSIEDKSISRMHALEEYLRVTKKKKVANYSFVGTKFEIPSEEQGMVHGKFVLRRKFYGYDRISIAADKRYVSLEKNTFMPWEFIENKAECSFIVDADKMLQSGVQRTMVTLKTLTQELHFSIILKKVSKKNDTKKSDNIELYKLIRDYITKEISERDYLERSANFTFMAKTPERMLLAAHVSGANGSSGEAISNLLALKNSFPDLEKNPIFESIATYIEWLIFHDENKSYEVIRKLSNILERYPDCFSADLAIFLIKDDGSAGVANAFADRQGKYHRNSPFVIYAKAVAIMRNPAVLEKIDIISLLALKYIIEHDKCSQVIAERFAYLAHNVSDEISSSKLFTEMLIKWYKKLGTDDMLYALVKHIVENKLFSESNFKFVELGVNKKLRINGIYEAYLRCSSASTEISNDIFIYFEYNSDIDEALSRRLYAGVIASGDEKVYIKYKDRIREYALKCAKEGLIDDDLAAIYLKVLTIDDPELLNVCFYYKVTCSSPEYEKVIVLEEGLKSECVYEIKNGTAFIKLLSDNYDIVFEAKDGARYISNAKYKLDSLMDGFDIAECFKMRPNDRDLLVNFISLSSENVRDEGELVGIYEKAIQIDAFDERKKNELILKVISNYYNSYSAENLDKYLEKIDLRFISAKDRRRLTDMMVSRDMYQRALDSVEKFGVQGLEPKWVRKLAQHQLAIGEGKNYDKELLNMLKYVERGGRSTIEGLQYLGRYFEGSLQEMYELWQQCKVAGTSSTMLEKRILLRIIGTNGYLSGMNEIFKDYYKVGREKGLIKAYVSLYSYKYLVRERKPSDEVFEACGKLGYYKENAACLLALIKYYSRKSELSDEELLIAKNAVKICERENFYIHFIRKLAKWFDIPCAMNNKYYVEYFAKPDSEVYIYYYDAEKDDYVRRKMRHLCYGIYIMDFIIFDGDEIEYYIAEEKDGFDIMMSDKITYIAALGNDKDSDYYRLNQIFGAHNLNDERTVIKNLREYAIKRYEAGNVFELM